MIAPAALLLAVFACLLVLSGSGGDDASAPEKSATRTTSTTRATPAGKTTTVTRSSYTVKAGDSFSAIAEKTGVDIGELQRLNPEIDPRALQPGQKLKLKE